LLYRARYTLRYTTTYSIFFFTAFITSKPLLSSDDIAVLVLHTWTISSEMFCDTDIKGPIPTLFAEQPEEVRFPIKLFAQFLKRQIADFRTLPSRDSPRIKTLASILNKGPLTLTVRITRRVIHSCPGPYGFVWKGGNPFPLSYSPSTISVHVSVRQTLM
jgi:hypothetical protein